MITRTITIHRINVETTGEPIFLDGKFSIREIKKLCENNGVEYVSHADYVSKERYQMSDEDFVKYANRVE